MGEIKPRFSEAGLATRAPRFSTAIEENVPRPLGAHRTASLSVALVSLRSTANQDIHDQYPSTFGPAPPILRQSCCECVHSLVHLPAREAVGLPPGRNESADLTMAAKNALRNMIDYLVDARGLTRQQTYRSTSVAADLKVSQALDVPNLIFSAFLPLDIVG